MYRNDDVKIEPSIPSSTVEDEELVLAVLVRTTAATLLMILHLVCY